MSGTRFFLSQTAARTAVAVGLASAALLLTPERAAAKIPVAGASSWSPGYKAEGRTLWANGIVEGTRAPFKVIVTLHKRHKLGPVEVWDEVDRRERQTDGADDYWFYDTGVPNRDAFFCPEDGIYRMRQDLFVRYEGRWYGPVRHISDDFVVPVP